VTFTKKQAPGQITYRWEANNVPRMYDEPGMPGITAVQHVLASTIPDWKALSRWYYKLSEPRIAAVTPAMSNTVAELTAGVSDPRKKIAKIFKHVSQKVRYMGITTEAEAPGYEPHDVKVTFDNKYGVCRDKAALLAAMLRMAGFRAYPTLIHYDWKKDPVVPEPYFNHAITCVELPGGEHVLMDPTDENTRDLLPAYLNNKSYLVAKAEGDVLRTTPVMPATQNLARVTTTARYDARGNLTANVRIALDGINDNAYRSAFTQMEVDEIRRMFEGVAKRVAPGAVLGEFEVLPDDLLDVSKPLTVKFSLTAPDMLIKGATTTIVPLPFFGDAVGLLDYVLKNTTLETRKYPLVTDLACGARETLTLDATPAVGAAQSLPTYAPVNTPQVAWQRSISAKDKTLNATAEFLIKAVEFTTNEYAALKTQLRAIEAAARKRALFTSAPATGGDEDDVSDVEQYEYVPQEDIEISKARIAYVISNATSGVVRETIRKKVLTYAGKKANAELKLSYNPAWETVRLVKAAVIDVDGNRKPVAAEEINIMDAPWANSAPRYPAAKTMVVSLPGVDTDTEIEYTVERAFHDMPLISFREYFNSYDPVVDKRVTVSVPKKVTATIRRPKSDEIESDTSERDGWTRHTWSTTDQRSVRKEDNLPPWYVFNPALLVSCGTWADYASSVNAALTKAATKQTAAAAKAKELTAGLATSDEKLRAMRDYVATAIRKAGPEFTALPLAALTPADTTITDGYGNNADRAIVLYAMLRAAGFAPAFVLASSLPAIKKITAPLLECPQRGTFDTVLVRVPQGDKTIYLNDTSQYAALGSTAHDGMLGLTVPAGTPVTITAADSDLQSRTDQRYAMTIDATGNAQIRTTITLRGGDDEDLRQMLQEMQPEERRQFQEAIAAELAQAARLDGPLTTDFSGYPGTISYSVHVPNYAVCDGDYLYFELPAELDNVLDLRANSRDNPLYWSRPQRSTTVTSVELPAAYAALELQPAAMTWQAPGKAGTIAISNAVADAKLTITQAVELQPALLPADDYLDLLDANRALSHPRMKTVLARKAR
jgi:transglutaminase-like putative cysteine protease